MVPTDRRTTAAFLCYAAVAVLLSAGIVLMRDIAMSLAILGGTGTVLAIAIVGARVMAMVFLCAAFAFGPLNSLRVAPWLTFGDVALVLAIGLAILASGWVFGSILLPTGYVTGSAILVLAGLMASFLADDIESLSNLALLVFAAVALPVLGSLWRPSMPQVELLAVFYLIGQSFSVLYGLLTPVSAGTGRVVGLSLRPNHFGLAATFAMGLAVFLVLSGRAWLRWFAVTTGTLCAAGVFVSGSRAALLAVLAMAVAVALIRRMWKVSALGLTAIATAVVAQDALLSMLPPNSALSRLIGDESVQIANASRLEVLTSNFDSFLASPLFGRGFANSLEAHNIYLQVATAAGVFGLIGFIFILYTAVRPLLRTDLGVLRWLAMPPLAYVVAGVVSNTLWDRFIWVLIGVAVLALRPGIGPGGAGVAAAAASGAGAELKGTGPHATGDIPTRVAGRHRAPG